MDRQLLFIPDSKKWQLFFQLEKKVEIIKDQNELTLLPLQAFEFMDAVSCSPLLDIPLTQEDVVDIISRKTGPVNSISIRNAGSKAMQQKFLKKYKEDYSYFSQVRTAHYYKGIKQQKAEDGPPGRMMFFFPTWKGYLASTLMLYFPWAALSMMDFSFHGRKENAKNVSLLKFSEQCFLKIIDSERPKLTKEYVDSHENYIRRQIHDDLITNLNGRNEELWGMLTPAFQVIREINLFSVLIEQANQAEKIKLGDSPVEVVFLSERYRKEYWKAIKNQLKELQKIPIRRIKKHFTNIKLDDIYEYIAEINLAKIDPLCIGAKL